jgi:uroporphyrin-III C-methyltransferase/precorrin-2 dehydrogenase/sirohydrochlorin ferrochelatase
MGLARIDHIVAKLIEHGAPADLPAGLIAQGTLPEQRVVTATLATLAVAAQQAKLQSPALLVVGRVVALHESLTWFNSPEAALLSQTA